MVLAPKQHKIKKGDTLELIANKFKIQKWEAIWTDDKNAKLKAKRKLPQNISAGDIIVIK